MSFFKINLTEDFCAAGFGMSGWVEHLRMDEAFLDNQDSNGMIRLKVTNGVACFSFSGFDDYVALIRPSGIRIDTISGEKSVVVTVHNTEDSLLGKYDIPSRYCLSVMLFEKGQLKWAHAYEKGSSNCVIYDPSVYRFPSGNTKKKILYAPIIPVYQTLLYTKGMCERGYNAKCMAYNKRESMAFMDFSEDYDLDCCYPHTNIYDSVTRKIEFFLYAVETYDIFHFQSNQSLLTNFYFIKGQCELEFLKKMGKKLVYSSWGWCDNCLSDTIRSCDYSECDVCVILRALYCKNEGYNLQIKQKLQYADMILSNAVCCVNDSRIKWMDNAIDTEEWRPMGLEEIPEKFRLPHTNKLRIFHSFGNAAVREDVKGSNFIRETVERLQNEGVELEFIYFDNVLHRDLKYYMVQADLVVDQLYAGWHGSAGVEALSLGKPMITYIDPAIWNIIPQKEDCPVIGASIHSLYDVIKDLIKDRKKMLEIGKKSREYACRYHDYRVVANALDQHYQTL